MLWEVRAPLLEEAKQSPFLLSDLAGLEQYIAESYDSRSFVELLQNADDAGASRFVIEKNGEGLLVANDGRSFTQSDFESLCRSAASSKSRGTSIGYRGIGFKSVVGFAQTIHLISGKLSATFSRERTARDIPQATRVPLVRIPHRLENDDRARFANVLDRLTTDGLATVFIFDHLLAGAIEKEFAAFDPTSLLFLRNVRHVDLRTNIEAVITVRRDIVDARTRSIRLRSDGGSSQWTIVEQSNIAIAFCREAEQIVKLDERDALVHAFLPTIEPTGLPVKIHGDISTDPSRMRVVFDERTAAGINDMAALVVVLLDEGLSGKHLPDPAGIIAALIPFTDPRTASFQRHSFKTDLFAAIQRASMGKFDNLRCRPSWINALDFEALAQVSGVRVAPRNLESIEGLSSLLRFLGAKDAGFDELSSALYDTNLTILGVTEVITHLVQLQATKQIDAKRLSTNWRLWPISGKVLSLKEAKAIAKPLDRDFIDLMAEKSGGDTGMRRLLTALTDAATTVVLLPESSTAAVSQQNERSYTPEVGPISLSSLPRVPPLSLKRWRSAEQQVLHLLVAQGWMVEDVSRQNLGYDIEGLTSGGEETYIEVKSIDYPGQPFILTSNEEAVARQKGQRYQLAIVRQVDHFLEVAFVRDPAQKLNFIRQCRQWVWECGVYEYAPQRFQLE